ncbi:MAG: hypothetical protein ACPGQT_03285 [Rhodothermales bacterium]
MTRSKSNWKKAVALAMLILGMLLMLFMIIVEDEPGAVPLMMIVMGSGYLIWRARRQRKQEI